MPADEMAKCGLNRERLRSLDFSFGIMVCYLLVFFWLSVTTEVITSFRASSNAEMIRLLKKGLFIKSESVEKAMLAVDRRHYSTTNPYDDAPQLIGYEATISAPHMHALALESLEDHLKEGSKVLDIGSGSGYLTACSAIMVGPTGKAVGIDHIPELVNISIENVKRGNPSLLTSNRVMLIVGNGRQGYSPEAPYDAIHVGAAAVVIPEALKDQLKFGGRMVLPVQGKDGRQWFTQVDKLPNCTLAEKKLFEVMFVPLTDRYTQSASSRYSPSTPDQGILQQQTSFRSTSGDYVYVELKVFGLLALYFCFR